MLHFAIPFNLAGRWLAAGRSLALLATVVCLVAIPEAQARQLSSQAEFAVSRQLREAQFSGTILVKERGRILFRRSFGLADRAFNVPVRSDTRFRVASITKLFTSVLVLMLVDRGALELDAPLSRYLPGYPGEGANRITLRHLLNHTSGLVQFDRVASLDEALSNGLPAYQQPRTPAQLLALCCSGAPARDAGSRFDYNNADYIVLGQVIERVTGATYAETLERLILRPLQLRATGLLHWERVVPRLAQTYYRRPGSPDFVNDLPVYWQNWYAAGSLYSSSGDIARFSDALFGGRVLAEASMAALLTPGQDDYGLGLWSYGFARAGAYHRVAKRPGSIMGANAMLYRLPDRGLVIVILANSNAVDLDTLAQHLAEAVLDGRTLR